MSDDLHEVIDSTPVDDTGADTADTGSAEPVDVGSLMDAAEPQDAPADAPSDVSGETQEPETDAASDIANLMDEAAMEEWNTQDTTEAPAETDVAALMDAGETEDFSKDTPDTPLEAEKSAYDELADYYSSHNYGQQHFSEYSKDPQWQELNNAYLQELGYDPIDYGNDEAPNIDDIRDELVAWGIPEDSPELAAILAYEQAGIDALKNDKEEESDMKDINDLSAETPLDEIPVLQDDDAVKSLKELMDETEADADTETAGELPEDLGGESSDGLPELPPSKAPDGDALQEKIEQIAGNPDIASETKVAELKAMKEMLLEYQQNHADQTDQDDGAMVKVLKMGGSDTGVAHHDYDAELANLDEGINEWQRVQEKWAAELNEELKQINENPNLSEAERVELMNQHYAKRDEYSKNYEKEFLELQTAREDLLGRTFPGELDAANNIAVKETDINDVPEIEDVSGWISDINPNYDPFDWQSPYANNCGSCAFAVEQRLEGNTDIAATGENIGSIEEMNKATGMEQVAMSPDEIRDYLISQGPGSHGIVGIDRVSGPGHWFNAYYDGKKVVAIDGQTGEINDWPPDYGDVTNWDISVRKEKA